MFLQKLKTFINLKTCASIRHCGSALYISGNKAKDNYAVLAPHIDVDERFKNIEKLADNVKSRNLSVNLDDVQQLWQLYRDIEHTKNKLEEQRVQIANKIKIIKDKSKNNSDDNIVKAIEKLSIHGKIIKEDLKVIKEHLLPVEENAFLKALELPNELHENTPKVTDNVIHEYLLKPQNINLNHLEIGKELNLLHYVNPNMYYLRGDLAKCDLLITMYFTDFFRERKFVPFSNTDFSKSVTVEGCGTKPSDFTKVFVLDESEQDSNTVNKMHLTGGASLYAFMALHARQIIYQKSFPLKYSSTGRCYAPCSNGFGLFDVAQASCGHIFSATVNSDEVYNEEFKQLLQLYLDFYKEFGFHFRVVYVAAKDLNLAESLRASIQMFSTYKKEYVEVGYLSLYDDYLSKRMLFTYRDGKENFFPKVISGTVINATKFLGCALEQDKQFSIRNVLKKYL